MQKIILKNQSLFKLLSDVAATLNDRVRKGSSHPAHLIEKRDKSHPYFLQNSGTNKITMENICTRPKSIAKVQTAF